MEYLRTTNLKTALFSYLSAKEINPKDPLIFNELGSVFYKQKNYEEAKHHFHKAL
jgi:Tfp pilus assembly protein PilF